MASKLGVTSNVEEACMNPESTVFAVRHEAYEFATTQRAVADLVSALQPTLAALFKKGNRVLVKVNMGRGVLVIDIRRTPSSPNVLFELFKSLAALSHSATMLPAPAGTPNKSGVRRGCGRSQSEPGPRWLTS